MCFSFDLDAQETVFVVPKAVALVVKAMVAAS